MDSVSNQDSNDESDDAVAVEVENSSLPSHELTWENVFLSWNQPD